MQTRSAWVWPMGYHLWLKMGKRSHPWSSPRIQRKRKKTSYYHKDIYSFICTMTHACVSVCKHANTEAGKCFCYRVRISWLYVIASVRINRDKRLLVMDGLHVASWASYVSCSELTNHAYRQQYYAIYLRWQEFINDVNCIHCVTARYLPRTSKHQWVVWLFM